MIYLVGFLITIGILVTIHEWGHYIVARYFNVKIQRFSIGFGKVIWKRTDKHDTEWVISAIPLGGYVKMLDSRNEKVPKHLYPFEFNHKKVWQRALIVAAGPLINIFFAFLLFTALYTFGIKDIKPILGEPTKGTPAYVSGIRGGEIVVKINQKPVNGWLDIRENIVGSGINEDYLSLTIKDNKYSYDQNIKINTKGMLKHPPTNIGLHPPYPNLPPIIYQLVDDYPAQKSGLVAGDRISKINQQPIYSWRDLTHELQKYPDEQITIEYLSAGTTQLRSVSLITQSYLRDGKKFGIIGIQPDREKVKIPEELIFRYSLDFPRAISHAFKRTIYSANLMVRFITGIIKGEVSWRLLNGPFVIAEIAGKSLADGLNTFIQFICAVSISLGIINLLPLPILDGGHLVFLAYETFTNRQPSKFAFDLLNRIGFTLIILLMATAIYNDIFHFFG